MSKISPLSLYVINRVKLLRIIGGIPAARLSVFLGHTPAYVFNVEKATLTAHYPPHEWPKLAEALKCQIHDFLPLDNTDQQSTGMLVNKVILDLSNVKDMQLIIEGLITNDYFKQSRTLADTAKYLYIVNDSDQMATLTKVLNQLTSTHQLNQNGELFIKP